MGRVRRGRRAALVVLVTAAGALPSAQAPVAAEPPLFTAVSVKPNTTGSLRSVLDLQPGGRFVAINVGVVNLVRVAYGDDGPLTPDRLSLNESWADRRMAYADKYDIQAVAERELTQADMPRALREVLSDRFKLVVHRETKTVSGYHLVLARADGRLGPLLRRSTIDCTQPAPSDPKSNDRPRCGFQNFPGKMAGRVPIADLARRVVPVGVADGRPVEDHTGLQGTFDFELTWTPDAAAGPRPPDAPPAPPIDPDGASFVTALREQLGLKVEARTSRIDVVVVDRAERPSVD